MPSRGVRRLWRLCGAARAKLFLGAAMCRGEGVSIHVIVEPGDLAVTHDERHGPFSLDSLTRRADPLALVAEDHDLVAGGEVLPGFEHLELGGLAERLEEPRDLVAAAVRPGVRQFGRAGDLPL